MPKFKKNFRIDNIKNTRKISNELEYKSEEEDLLNFLNILKDGFIYENENLVKNSKTNNIPNSELSEIYTKFVALKRPMYDDDIILDCEVLSNKITNTKIKDLIYTDTTYFTINSFRKMYKSDRLSKYKVVERSLKSLKILNCIALDIDCGDNPGLSLVELYEKLEYAVKNILPCTFIVCSGNGFHVYWNIKNEYLYKFKEKKIKVYRQVAKYLSDELLKHNIHCDCKVTGDTQRILRLPYSYNTKNGELKKCIIWYSDYSVRYNLLQLNKEFKDKFTYIKNPKIKVSKSKLKKINITSEQQRSNKEYEQIPSGFESINDVYKKREYNTLPYWRLTAKRIEDIKMFIKAKDTDKCYYNGRRHEIIMNIINMICRNNLEFSDHYIDCIEVLNEVNKCFTEPLSDIKIEDLIRYYKSSNAKILDMKENNPEMLNGTKGRSYTVSNEHLIKLLGLTNIDISYSRVITNEDEKERRKKLKLELNKQLRANKRDNNKQKINEIVKDLTKKGKSNEFIAKEIKKSTRTVIRIKKELGL